MATARDSEKAASGAPPRIGPEAEWLHRRETQAVFAALRMGGFEARAVGGAVRNALLGRPVTDVDIATTATPDAVMALAEQAGLKAVPTGLDHGTVTVVADHTAYEVTTLRRDVETFGRHARVAFTTDWVADAERRDFTMNALYCDADGTLFDPLGGYGDLMAGRVRFIGDAAMRIREDYLRILRFFRLHGEYGRGAPDAEGLAACVRERAGLAGLSRERVGAEIKRLMLARGADGAVRAMFEHGLLVLVLASAVRVSVFARLTAIEAALARPPDAMLRLGALAVHVREDGGRLARRLRLSRRERGRLEMLGEARPRLGAHMPEQAARAALYHLGRESFEARVLLAWARSGAGAQDTAWRSLLGLPARWQAPAFPVTGGDLVALGASPGPAIGEVMRRLEAEWVAGDFAESREGLLARARASIEAAREQDGENGARAGGELK